MVDASLSISFSNPLDDPDYFLLIEQEPWGDDVGQTSTVQAIAAMQTAIYGSAMPTLNCGGANGVFRTRVFVYPSDNDMTFQFKLSNGIVVGHIVESIIREEIIQCSMGLEQETDYPVNSIISSAFLGKCYDSTGNIVTHPNVEINGKIITFDTKVYGSLSLRYYVKRHVYEVEVRRRQLAIENTYQCLAYCVYDGGVEWCDVEAPAGFEETHGACENGDVFAYMEDLANWLNNLFGLGGIGHINRCRGKYRTIPVAAYADREITVDYCTQEIKSDSTTEDVDTETEKYYDGTDCPDVE